MKNHYYITVYDDYIKAKTEYESQVNTILETLRDIIVSNGLEIVPIAEAFKMKPGYLYDILIEHKYPHDKEMKDILNWLEANDYKNEKTIL